MTRILITARALFAFARIVKNPDRLDVVFDLVDGVVDDPESQREIRSMLDRPHVARAAQLDVRLPALTVAGLLARPEGSTGHVAGRFFEANGLDPAALPRREAKSAEEWFSAHLYETHDLWHVATGLGPDIAGELGLQGFYAAQVDGSVALAILAAGMMNTLLFAKSTYRERIAAIARGWEMGRRAENLVGLDWAAWLDRPLDELRAHLGIVVEEEHDAMATFRQPQVAQAA